MIGRDLGRETGGEAVQKISGRVDHAQETEREGRVPGMGVRVVLEIEDIEAEGVAPMTEGDVNEKGHDPGIVHEIGKNADLDHVLEREEVVPVLEKEEVVPDHVLGREGADISIFVQLTTSSSISTVLAHEMINTVLFSFFFAVINSFMNIVMHTNHYLCVLVYT